MNSWWVVAAVAAFGLTAIYAMTKAPADAPRDEHRDGDVSAYIPTEDAPTQRELELFFADDLRDEPCDVPSLADTDCIPVCAGEWRRETTDHIDAGASRWRFYKHPSEE